MKGAEVTFIGVGSVNTTENSTTAVLTNHRESKRARLALRSQNRSGPCTGHPSPSSVESDGRMGRSLSVGRTPAKPHTHTSKACCAFSCREVFRRNKVALNPPRSTPVVTLAWEHPFPTDIVHSIRTNKVPQPALPTKTYLLLRCHLSFLHFHARHLPAFSPGPETKHRLIMTTSRSKPAKDRRHPRWCSSPLSYRSRSSRMDSAPCNRRGLVLTLKRTPPAHVGLTRGWPPALLHASTLK